MKVFVNPERKMWSELCKRPQLELEFLDSAVRNILDRVRKSGDTALRELTKQFDKVDLATLEVSKGEIDDASRAVPNGLKDAIRLATDNIIKFHSAQAKEEEKIETMRGVTCWRRAVAIEHIGIYIPGGSAPLFSTVLMLAVPAMLAGCKQIVLCSPPDQYGNINPAILYAASLTGITRIFKVGGAQAIAALAYGTESIPRVNKITGPGNQFVTKAKQIVSNEGTAIDFPAGPSEVLIIADAAATPAFVAADLLAQAEHGEDSQVMLVVNDALLVKAIQNEVDNQLQLLPRKGIAEKALLNSKIIVIENTKDIIDFVNEYAPEHLIINRKEAELIANAIKNAGSVFIGNYSAEAVGDYASGTNHTLPTNGYARSYSGISVESFTKYITFQKLTADGIKNIGPVVERMAEAEGLEAHKQSVRVRLNQLRND